MKTFLDVLIQYPITTLAALVVIAVMALAIYVCSAALRDIEEVYSSIDNACNALAADIAADAAAARACCSASQPAAQRPNDASSHPLHS